MTGPDRAAGKDVVYGPSPGSTGSRRFFSITHDMLGDPFWAVYRRGLNDAATAYGCTVHHLAPDQFSAREMIMHLNSAIEAQPHGILSTVPDAEVVDEPLRRAIASGIPVIAVNAPDIRAADRRIPYLLYIGADDVSGGATAATQLLERVHPTSAICVDHYLADNACHNQRWSGFARVMEGAGVLVDRMRVPGEQREQAIAMVADRLRTRRPGAVCTLGPPGASVVIDAVTHAQLDEAVPHGSFDLAPAQIDAVRHGSLLFTIDSQQYLQGYLGITLLMLHAQHGFTLASDVLTGPVIIDSRNVDRVQAQVADAIR